ncbi:DMT family transporter [Pontibacter fetidus]|uniref:Multidrug resistance efflux transporter family protein n=1 Tax=Pontibacter fetidus TaxID=2700082 RepID=A0A6B2H041_9BACT|nr:multidrug resistance efflux transporter family protein [Pontibacter fetidus]NDK55488.1 multidrug resistance efflux transporter family protein [Pontibacter fetidus]
MQANQNLKAIGMGVVASVFFCSTYVFNSFISVANGHWAWTVSLRTIFLLVILLGILQIKDQLKPLWRILLKMPGTWVFWGSIWFGLVYVLLTAAASFGPGWLVAGVFQFTIVAGILLSPFLYKDSRAKIPVRALLLSILILVGIALMQWSQRNGSYSDAQLLICIVLVLLAAVIWPLANRKMLLFVEEQGYELNAMQRVAGTAMGSLPALFILMGIGYYQAGLPGQTQLWAVFVIALSSGVIGTILFFKATHLARTDSAALAAVEATQSIEILATVTGEVLLLGIAWPNLTGNVGMLLVTGGLILYSLPARKKVLRPA